MQAASFYLLYPLLYLASRSPFSVMYAISDLLYFLVYRVARYRRGVVSDNLRNAFPNKTEEERIRIERKFYRYLCDLTLETLKTITWKEEQVRERVVFHESDDLKRFYEEGRSFIIVMGHLGNWEWAGPGFSLHNKHQLYVVYHPLSNPYFNRMLVKARTKFQTRIVPRPETMRHLVTTRKQRAATALIADQAPSPIELAHWMTFLNQDTPVLTGPERVARKMDQPVVYMGVRRTARGYYEITPEVLFENPLDTEPLEITTAFNKKLEEDIQAQPETWLWSHRRWKHKRPTEIKSPSPSTYNTHQHA